jgi:Small-conductance mechanosensitive channel
MGNSRKKKTRALIRLFRPHRNGDLTKLDFVRSCDKIYRRARMFRATTLASAQLDDAFEQLINIAFYFLTGFVVLVVVGFDTTRIFSFSAGIFSLSFMFGASASRYLEGVLLVLARQPFDVGDRIAISDPQSDTSMDGSLTWFVENISLYQTTVRQGATNEMATYSNSSLAHSRIINAARSPKAMTFVYLKFGIDVPYSKVMIFKDVVEKFVKDRPREFIKVDGFRATTVEADMGYIQYVIVLLHVDSWQNIAEVLQAKADVASFCLEVQKKMNMRYVAPPMPVDLSVSRRKLLPGEAAEIGLADFSSTTSAEFPARSVFEQDFNGRSTEGRNDELPPRVPTHIKNDSLGYSSIAEMFAKDLEQGGGKKKK